MVFKNLPKNKESIFLDEENLEMVNELVGSEDEYQTDDFESDDDTDYSSNEELYDLSPLCSFCKLKCNHSERFERFLPCLRVICEVSKINRFNFFKFSTLKFLFI